jgi:hypothetical protein
MLGSWPALDDAALRIGTEPSGAVSSSWMVNRLICVMATARGSLRGVSVEP